MVSVVIDAVSRPDGGHSIKGIAYRPVPDRVHVHMEALPVEGDDIRSHLSRQRNCGTSPQSVQQTICNGLARARQTLRNLECLEVSEIRGQIVDSAVAQFQVGLKGGFRLDDASQSRLGRRPKEA